MRLTLKLLAASALLSCMAAPSVAADKVTFGTNWLAQAEHGGFYQAVADGTYEAYGLEVTITQGGPQSPNEALLISGKVDFYMGGALSLLDDVQQDIPMVNVAAIFQKNPQVFLAHPDAGVETFADLAKLDTIYLSNDVFTTSFQWMKQTYPGFRDEQFRPYMFNPAPFMANKNSAQQGFLSSEPFAVMNADGGFEPKVFLLADEGYDPYGTTIETTQKLVAENPDLVQRFVDASIIGWYNYLYGDSSKGNALIKADNPEMSDELIAYSIAKMKEVGIVVSGDAVTKGIGCMTDTRHKAFFDTVVKIGLFPADLDYTKSYTTQFVCKGVGVELATP